MTSEISTMGAPQLNIKDAETTRMVRELAELTGETQTEVVRKAVEDRLRREKSSREERDMRRKEAKRREFETTWAEIERIQAEVKALRLADNMLTDDDLYGENGLPKCPRLLLSTRLSSWPCSETNRMRRTCSDAP
jgi:hypothetical protein